LEARKSDILLRAILPEKVITILKNLSQNQLQHYPTTFSFHKSSTLPEGSPETQTQNFCQLSNQNENEAENGIENGIENETKKDNEVGMKVNTKKNSRQEKVVSFQDLNEKVSKNQNEKNEEDSNQNNQNNSVIDNQNKNQEPNKMDDSADQQENINEQSNTQSETQIKETKKRSSFRKISFRNFMSREKKNPELKPFTLPFWLKNEEDRFRRNQPIPKQPELLPSPIRAYTVICQRNVSILFADIVGFTSMSSTVSAETLVIFIFIILCLNNFECNLIPNFEKKKG